MNITPPAGTRSRLTRKWISVPALLEGDLRPGGADAGEDGSAVTDLRVPGGERNAGGDAEHDGGCDEEAVHGAHHSGWESTVH